MCSYGVTYQYPSWRSKRNRSVAASRDVWRMLYGVYQYHLQHINSVAPISAIIVSIVAMALALAAISAYATMT